MPPAPAVIDRKVAGLSGGKLKGGPLLLKVVEASGVEFVTVEKSFKWKQYLGQNFEMVDHIKALRNEATDAAMRRVQRQAVDDPMADHEGQKEEKIEDRKSTFDSIEPFLAVTVKVKDGEEHRVNVMTDWYSNRALAIELTAANMDLLLKSPEVMPDSHEEMSGPEPLRHFEVGLHKVVYDPKKAMVYSKFNVSKKRRYASQRVVQDEDPDVLETNIGRAVDKVMQMMTWQHEQDVEWHDR